MQLSQKQVELICRVVDSRLKDAMVLDEHGGTNSSTPTVPVFLNVLYLLDLFCSGFSGEVGVKIRKCSMQRFRKSNELENLEEKYKVLLDKLSGA